jgi:hypothetical protein
VRNLSLFVKTFTNATEAQRSWVSRQLLPVLISAATDAGADATLKITRRGKK